MPGSAKSSQARPPTPGTPPVRPLGSRMTLTARLTALYTLVSATVLLGLGGLTLYAVQRHFDELDQATLRMMSMWGAPSGTSPADYRQGLRARGMIVGGADEVLEALGRYAAAGLQEVEFQHFDFADDAVPEFLAAEVAPAAKAL